MQIKKKENNEIYTSYNLDKRYRDLIYGALEEMAYVEDDCKYVDKANISYVKLGEKIGITRQTISTRFKRMLDNGLISYDGEKQRYQLCLSDEENLCSLIPFDTLRQINNTLDQNTINIYIYLLKRYIANDKRPFHVYISQIKDFIKVSAVSVSNNVVIKDMLNVLQLLGLVKVYYQINNEKRKVSIQIAEVNNIVIDSKHKIRIN